MTAAGVEDAPARTAILTENRPTIVTRLVASLLGDREIRRAA
jgi:hypothetical protein